MSLANLLESSARRTPSITDILSDIAPPAPQDSPIGQATQQRIYRLEDQLQEARKQVADLHTQLAAYEQNPTAGPEAEQTPERLPANRHEAVLEAATDARRLPHLRFLTNADRDLPNYGKPRPSAEEIISALTAINDLADAWIKSPDGSTGPWVNFFRDIKGWQYRPDETETTMALYGEKRSFSDQDLGRHVTVTRHLTHTGSRSGFQIFFDADPDTGKFIVAYLGAHLPYASENS